MWVAEADGDLVGFAEGNLRWTSSDRGRAEVWVAVGHAARGGGRGHALYERVDEHLSDATLLDTDAVDDDGIRFAERLGFRVARRERYSELNPQTVTLPNQSPPAGVAVVPLAEVLDRPHELHGVYAEGELDLPGGIDRDWLDYDEWAAETLANPLLDPELSMIVLEHDRPVSLAFVEADREGSRADHEMTSTLRSHRGRGLARLAKIAAIHACREAGIERLTTSNDLTNVPMLAINDRLGYRPTEVTTGLEKGRVAST
jgi:GNAT superfamily N-acetyltransferase